MERATAATVAIKAAATIAPRTTARVEPRRRAQAHGTGAQPCTPRSPAGRAVHVASRNGGAAGESTGCKTGASENKTGCWSQSREKTTCAGAVRPAATLGGLVKACIPARRTLPVHGQWHPVDLPVRPRGRARLNPSCSVPTVLSQNTPLALRCAAGVRSAQTTGQGLTVRVEHDSRCLVSRRLQFAARPPKTPRQMR